MLRDRLRLSVALLVSAKPQTIFLITALSLGCVFVFLTAPFGVADEPNHFYRAYQISEGVSHPVKLADGQYGGILPQNLITLTKQLDGDYGNPNRVRIPFRQLLAAKNLRIDNARTTSIAFTNTAVYEPATYLPQVIGIWLARLLPGRPDFLPAFYLARLTNLLVGVVLLYIAITVIPFAKWGIVVLFLTPMAIFQFASLSPDSLTFGLVALGISYSLACLYAALSLDKKDLIYLGGLVLAMTLLRVPYSALAIIPFSVLVYSLKQRLPLTKVALLTAPLALLSIFLALYWQAYFGSDVHLTIDPTIDPTRQIHTVVNVPWMFEVAVRTQLSGFFNIVTNGVVGVLGWLDTPLPQWTITGYSFFLIASFFVATPGEKKQASTRLRWLFMLAFVLSLVAVDVIEYLYGSPVKSAEIFGIQGRYYIPLLVLLLIATHSAIKLSAKDWQKFHLSRLAFIGLSQIVAVIVVLNHSWLNIK